MGFAEALADDGKLSGRGAPLLRGLVCGLMTFAGGIGHTLPYLIPQFLHGDGHRLHRRRDRTARDRTSSSGDIMSTPPLAAAAKVMLGGGLVLAAGILIGSS